MMNKLTHFISPDIASVLKGVPNTKHWHDTFDTTWKMFKNHYKLSSNDVTYWKRYRGPRISGNSQDCKHEDGYSFSVYFRSKVDSPKFDDIIILLADEMKDGGFLPFYDRVVRTIENNTPVQTWISDTVQNTDFPEIVEYFPNFKFYNKYALELERYFAGPPNWGKMFVDFIRSHVAER
jgi:hypothetical protein